MQGIEASESILANDVVHKRKSIMDSESIVDEEDEASESGFCFDDLCDHQQERFQLSGVEEMVDLFQRWADVHDKQVAHHLLGTMSQRVQSKRKQQKSPKAWKFKFKRRTLSSFMPTFGQPIL
ncbi:unnamed protein product [Arabis nemorensis]|uniref:Uncharacterized protein n=1 Tax=Arabis nemorensis TaxID=586526 RepID=A0A565C7R6_9BRAS|nr:unnamed protein product [Arabis nemorensis]